MPTYRITNTISGHCLGDYEGANEAEALDAMASDAGYVDHAAACEVAPVKEGELRVVEVDAQNTRTDAPTYTVFANVEQQDTSEISSHQTLAAAGRAYQAAHTGNLRRVLDDNGRDVTAEACDAANATK